MAAGAIVAASAGHAATLPEPVQGTEAVQEPVTVTLAEPQITSVTVEKGDTLSSIAASNCENTADWTGIWTRNKNTIGSNWNLIKPGQVLFLDCKVAALPVLATSDSFVRTVRTPVRTTYHARATSGYSGRVNPGSYSGFQACVISRESGGRSQVMNSSEHYGLYQFSESTWVAYGGSAADFGHASVGEQNRVFGNAMARGGEYNWSPYDGC